MPKGFHRGKNTSTRRTDRFIEDNIVQNERVYYSMLSNHDTRETSDKQKFRPSFKSGRIDRNRSRPVDSSKLQRIIEQDVDMAGSSSHGDSHPRHVPYSRPGGRKSNHARPQQNSRGGSSWSKVTIPHGKKFEKDFILKTLLNASKVSFIPIYYHIEGNNAVFFIEDSTAAEALSTLNKQITLHDGFKLIILVKWSPAPNLPINEDLKGKIKQVMSRRYDPQMKMLNLSQFHLDEELCTDFYTPLSRENVMQTVVQIIGDHIPDVQVIDLSNNKIYSVDQMKPLVTKAVFLKSLNLGNNKLGQITSLDRLQGLKLEELVLNRNPLCDRFNEQSTYISAVRKRFPKLIKLDGVELPPVISFDIGAEDVALPLSSGSWFVSDEARQIVLVFLEQYLSVYDSDDRQPLLNAYHDSAIMSLTCSYPPGQTANAPSRLDSYMKDSRNLKRIDDPQRRFRLLQQGKVDIVSFLSKLPKTLHDPSSLVVDVPVTSSHLIVMSVTGVFRERVERHSLIRWFQRIFIIIPSTGGGFCIVNEQIHISCATPEQIKAAFKEPVVVPAGLSTPASSVPIGETTASSTLVDPVVQQQMVASFSEQSGMNTTWSLKCLEENGWVFDRAAFVFTELKAANQIPPEAFIK
ncbi:hypothetical protein DAPPUDRAFT_332592 [Daphnia pulex]|uniref:NTF2 domain-containing protein n=1 Tax=Daphnia pulex TaxID=6669 RepID=E9HQD3_DAPPU|nr:hypothetical protein DAPPUDRAFT_332592 [Daphnia pulex]|eukprot:EFX66035.1 hypothetical protein DAPPUDRAFT_332592 [Daphnia pulex]